MRQITISTIYIFFFIFRLGHDLAQYVYHCELSCTIVGLSLLGSVYLSLYLSQDYSEGSGTVYSWLGTHGNSPLLVLPRGSFLLKIQRCGQYFHLGVVLPPHFLSGLFPLACGFTFSLGDSRVVVERDYMYATHSPLGPWTGPKVL